MKLIKKLETRRNKNGKMYRWALFYCEYCNQEVEKRYSDGVKCKSCGCARSHVTHGCAHTDRVTKLYSVWVGMKQRCRNINDQDYKYYGARGIRICEEWLKSFVPFKKWALTHGYKDNLQIDRRNNDKGYGSSNCRWVMHKINMQNSRNAKLTMKKVNQIRNLYLSIKITQTLLGKIFSMSTGQINKIVNNKSWV